MEGASSPAGALRAVTVAMRDLPDTDGDIRVQALHGGIFWNHGWSSTALALGAATSRGRIGGVIGTVTGYWLP